MTSKFNPQEIEYELMYENEENHWWYSGLRSLLMFWVNELNPKNVLDAGCGTGINMTAIKNSGTPVTGIDISTLAVKYSKKRGHVQVYRGSISSLPFKNSEFDLIYCMDVLGTLNESDSIKAMTEFNRCLKKSGHLIINAAALQWLYSVHDKAWDIKRRYSKDELKKLLESASFQPLKISYRVSLLFVPVLLVKLADRFLRSARINPDDKFSGNLDHVNPLLNWILSKIMSFENRLLLYMDFPFGSSIFSVSIKK